MNKRFFINVFLIAMVLLLCAAGKSFAQFLNVTIQMASWMQFSSNDPPQVLPVITVTDVGGGVISPANNIAIILPKDVDVLWDRTVSQVTVNNSSLLDVLYSKDLKKLIIPVSKTFAAGEAVSIVGQKVRIYERGSGYSALQVDINGDGIGDANSGNGIQLDDTVRRWDSLAPFTITSLTSAVNDKSVTLRWENPPDPDLYGLVISRTLIRNGTTTAKEIKLDGVVTLYEDTDVAAGDSLQYAIKARDNNNNLSEEVSMAVQIPVPQPEQLPSVIINETVQPEIVEQQPEEERNVQPGSVLDGIGQADIDVVLNQYLDIDGSTQNLKEIVYLVKSGFMKGKRNKLAINESVKCTDFVQIAGKAFSIGKAKSALAYLKVFKKLGYLSVKTKSTSKITRRKAFKILLSIRGISFKDQAILDYSALKGYVTRKDLAIWIVKILDF